MVLFSGSTTQLIITACKYEKFYLIVIWNCSVRKRYVQLTDVVSAPKICPWIPGHFGKVFRYESVFGQIYGRQRIQIPVLFGTLERNVWLMVAESQEEWLFKSCVVVSQEIDRELCRLNVGQRLFRLLAHIHRTDNTGVEPTVAVRTHGRELILLSRAVKGRHRPTDRIVVTVVRDNA